MNLKNLAIKHDFQYQMFFVKVKGGIAYLKYDQPVPNVLNYKETYVPQESRKRGVGTQLVMYAMDFALSNGSSIIPTCPFVDRFVNKNPEFQKILEKNHH